MNRIYNHHVNFENGCEESNWMEASFDIVVASLKYGIPFGCYNIGIGFGFIIQRLNETTLAVKTYDSIVPPEDNCNMLIYNGFDHFYYLHTGSVEKITTIKSEDGIFNNRNIKNNSTAERKKAPCEIIPFIPNYFGCLLFMKVIGFDVEDSDMIGYKLLQHRAFHNNNTSDHWRTKQKNIYKDVY